MAKNIKATVEKLAWPIVEQMGYVYVDTEYAKQGQDYLLTIYIDKPGGVQLDDCEAVSRKLETVLDEQDIVANSYCLCVSSPGLDRPLKNDRDFKRVLGELVDVKLYQPFNDKKLFTGKLSAYTDSSVSIETEEEEIVFELTETAKICLHLDI